MSEYVMLYLQHSVWDYIWRMENSLCSSHKLGSGQFLFLFSLLTISRAKDRRCDREACQNQFRSITPPGMSEPLITLGSNVLLLYTTVLLLHNLWVSALTSPLTWKEEDGVKWHMLDDKLWQSWSKGTTLYKSILGCLRYWASLVESPFHVYHF